MKSQFSENYYANNVANQIVLDGGCFIS